VKLKFTIDEKNSIILVALLLFTSVQGQWINEKGKGYYKIGSWSLLADEHYTDQGIVDPNATRGLFINSIYAQYGLSTKINLITYIPFLVKNYQFAQVSQTNGKVYEPRQEYNGFGDINLGLEYGLKIAGNWVFSTTLTFGIPSGKSQAGSDGSYQTGDGEFNQLLQFNLGSGYGIGKQNFYLKSYFGLNNRTQGFSDEVHSYFETGTQVLKNKLLLLTRVHWIKPLYNGTLSAESSNGSIFANNVESMILGGEMAFQIGKKWGVSATLTQPLFGKVIFKATTYSGGIFFNL
jgi:hypothetical protein